MGIPVVGSKLQPDRLLMLKQGIEVFLGVCPRNNILNDMRH